MVMEPVELWRVTVPWKTFTVIVPSGRMYTSNLVPRTLAVAALPLTSKLVPVTRCCTFVNVRPTCCERDTSWRWPLFVKWAESNVTEVSLARRVSVPSGSVIPARPLVSVATVSPARTIAPVVAAPAAPEACARVALGRYTVTIPEASTWAWAAMFSQTTAPATTRTSIARPMRMRRPPRRGLGAGLEATVAMLPGKDSSKVVQRPRLSVLAGRASPVPLDDHHVVPVRPRAGVDPVDDEPRRDRADRAPAELAQVPHPLAPDVDVLHRHLADDPP